MAKVLHWSDLVKDCNYQLQAESEEEILQAAAEHAQSVHGMEVTSELAEAVRNAIKEE